MPLTHHSIKDSSGSKQRMSHHMSLYPLGLMIYLLIVTKV